MDDPNMPASPHLVTTVAGVDPLEVRSASTNTSVNAEAASGQTMQSVRTTLAGGRSSLNPTTMSNDADRPEEPSASSTSGSGSGGIAVVQYTTAKTTPGGEQSSVPASTTSGRTDEPGQPSVRPTSGSEPLKSASVSEKPAGQSGRTGPVSSSSSQSTVSSASGPRDEEVEEQTAIPPMPAAGPMPIRSYAIAAGARAAADEDDSS